jgi:5-methylcytosine-specific restriction endonuclease McrA
MEREAIACGLCGANDESAAEWVQIYGSMVKGADVCADCAARVANAFSKKYSGKWLTYENPPAEKSKKVPIPADLRTAVFERDAYRCRHCNGYSSLTADHMHPESKGGEATLENLQTLCRSCNSKKRVG